MNDRWAHKSTTCKSYIGWAARVGARGWPFKDNMAVGFNCFSILFNLCDVIKHIKKKRKTKTKIKTIKKNNIVKRKTKQKYT